MHRPSEMAEFEWQNQTAAGIAIAVPESPAEDETNPEGPTEEPTTRRSEPFGMPVELLGQEIPLVLCEARDPDEEEGEEEDLDYLYDDEDDDVDDDLDEDLDEFEDEEEEFEDEDEEL